MNPTALIAEDEDLLRAGLQAELARLWPELRIVASVAHGAAAVEQALALLPQVLVLTSEERRVGKEYRYRCSMDTLHMRFGTGP